MSESTGFEIECTWLQLFALVLTLLLDCMCLQVAMVQFTDDPRTEFKLDAYKTKETLLDAIRHISYKGGNTKTGKTQTFT